MQLPAGVLVDRYGPRRVAGTGTFVMGFGAVAFAMSDSFLVSFLARALVGFGGSVIFLAILRFAVTWFRADEYATVTGLTIGVSALGGIIATTPLRHRCVRHRVAVINARYRILVRRQRSSSSCQSVTDRLMKLTASHQN